MVSVSVVVVRKLMPSPRGWCVLDISVVLGLGSLVLEASVVEAVASLSDFGPLSLWSGSPVSVGLPVTSSYSRFRW